MVHRRDLRRSKTCHHLKRTRFPRSPPSEKIDQTQSQCINLDRRKRSQLLISSHQLRCHSTRLSSINSHFIIRFRSRSTATATRMIPCCIPAMRLIRARPPRVLPCHRYPNVPFMLNLSNPTPTRSSPRITIHNLTKLCSRHRDITTRKASTSR